MSTDRTSVLHDHLSRRILVLDGAMGTMIQRHTLTEKEFRGARFASHGHDLKGNNDLLILTRPDVIAGIHREYLAAGSDIIETNTFSSNAIAQADYSLESLVYELNFEGAKLARAAADEYSALTPDQPRFVAGSMGPTNRILSISPDVNNPAFRNMTFDQLREAFKEQARGLIDGGCDLLLLETIVDTLNAKAGIVAIEEVFEEKGVRLPLMISVTVTDRSGRTLSGQTIDAFWISIAHARPFSVGVNCALGARDMRPYVEELARHADCYISCYPNAGLPNAFGEYDELPGDTAGALREFADGTLVNIVGGCCGTTPDHIRAIAAAVNGLPPRVPTKREHGVTERNTENTVTRPICRGFRGRCRLRALRVEGVVCPGICCGGEFSRVAGGRALHPVRWARGAHHPAREQLPDDRRADERHRLDAIRAPDQGGRLRRSGQRCARAGPGWREPDRREHGRRHARLRAGDDRLPELHRDRARDCARADRHRQLQVVGAAGRAQVRPGETGRQFHQPERGRSGLPAEGRNRAPLRGGRGGDGVRRAGTGRHGRPQGGDLSARL